MNTALEAMRAERDRLDREIKTAEERACTTWNDGLNECESALVDWLRANSVESASRDRKNEHIWDIGHGALRVNFGYHEAQWGPWLQMTSGDTLTLAWKEVPTPDRFIAIVAACLSMKAENTCPPK